MAARSIRVDNRRTPPCLSIPARLLFGFLILNLLPCRPKGAIDSLLNFRFIISLSLHESLQASNLGILFFHEDANLRKIGGVIVPVVVPHYSPGIE